jgi:hypothetical protein
MLLYRMLDIYAKNIVGRDHVFLEEAGLQPEDTRSDAGDEMSIREDPLEQLQRQKLRKRDVLRQAVSKVF